MVEMRDKQLCVGEMNEREQPQLNKDVESKKGAIDLDLINKSDFKKSLVDLFDERDKWADRFLVEQRRFEEERRNFVEELDSREREFVSRQKAQAEAFSKREKLFEEQIKELSERSERREIDFQARRKMLESEFLKRSDELVAKQKQINAFQSELEAERDRLKKETQEKLQHNSSGFVKGMVDDLKIRENHLFTVSNRWSMFGGFCLLTAIVIFAALSVHSAGQVKSDMSWAYLTFYAFKGVFLAAISGIIARYSFVLSLNHMSEALRTTDRIHAIKFGQLYVESYGASANWDQVKEAFSNWNGFGSHRFDSNFEPGGDITKLSNIVTSIKELANGKE